MQNPSKPLDALRPVGNALFDESQRDTKRLDGLTIGVGHVNTNVLGNPEDTATDFGVEPLESVPLLAFHHKDDVALQAHRACNLYRPVGTKVEASFPHQSHCRVIGGLSNERTQARRNHAATGKRKTHERSGHGAAADVALTHQQDRFHFRE
jgi:hypothetical protein